jgi:hypothetical protein
MKGEKNMEIKIPRMLKKINQADAKVKSEVEEMIKEALESDCIQSYPIEEMTLNHLDILAEYGKENNILILIKAEHSNFHSGTLIELLKKDLVDEFKRFL